MEVTGWVTYTEAGDEYTLSVRTFAEDEPDVVSLDANIAFGGQGLMTPKEARELARDLNAAAKAAASR